MKLKRVYAPDTKTGIERITRQCGDNVMILSNRRQDDQNVILVAVDNDASPPATVESMRFEQILANREESLKQQLESDSVAPDTRAKATKKPVIAQDNERPTVTITSKAGDSGPSDHHNGVEAQAMRSLALQIRQELTSLKSEIASLRSAKQFANISGPAHPLLEYLRETGATDSYLDECRELLSRGSDPNPLTHLVADHLRHSKLVGQPIKPGIHALFGNHGCGKTTLAIKLASFLSSTDKPAIVVSYRDDKDGAWSVLQVLGAKAGIATFQACGEENLRALIKEFSNSRSIIIDTSSNTVGDCLQDISKAAPEARCHLVLPADTYLTSLPPLVKQHLHRFESALVSRLDQVVQPWPLLKILSANGLPASMGCGHASVLDKLIEVTAETLSRKLIQESGEWAETPPSGINDDAEFAFHLF